MKKTSKKTKEAVEQFDLDALVKDAQNRIQDFVDIQFNALRTELITDFEQLRHRAEQRLDQLEQELK